MKRITPILFFLFAIGNAKAQVSLPNGSFETWSTIPYDPITAPTSWPWISSNLATMNIYGVAGVSKVTGFSGQYALRLETKQAGNDIVPAFISNTDNIINSPREGVPYYFEPTLLHGKYRYDIKPGDTAYIKIVFRKNGNDIFNKEFHITGQQSVATNFTFPITPKPIQPDILLVYAYSSYNKPIAGSWIELDSLTFSDGMVSDTIPGGDFENWMPSDTYDRLAKWNDGCYYNQKVKTTDKYSGNYALQLTSTYDPIVNMHHAANVWIEAPLDSMGADFPGNSDTLTGFYKYSTSGPDRGTMMISCRDKNKVPIGSTFTKYFTSTSTFTYFEIPINLPSKPEFIQISIYSSDYSNFQNVTDGSALILDDLKLKNPPTGVNDIKRTGQQFAVYPNPVNSTLYLNIEQAVFEPITIALYDITGRLVANYTFDDNGNKVKQVPISDLAPGLYHFKILNGESVSNGKFLKK